MIAEGLGQTGDVDGVHVVSSLCRDNCVCRKLFIGYIRCTPYAKDYDGAVSDVELPRGIALAWGIAVDPQRGPKRELSVEKIVDAAIEIADADGLGAVSMSSVANPARLHDDVAVPVRVGQGRPDRADERRGTGATSRPRAGRRRLARWPAAMGAGVERRLRSASLAAGHPDRRRPDHPNNLAWLDWGLRLLAPARLSASRCGRGGADDQRSDPLAGDRSTGPSPPASWARPSSWCSASSSPPSAIRRCPAALAAGGLSDDESRRPVQVRPRACARRSAEARSATAGPVERRVGSVRGRQVADVEVPRDARLKEATRIRREAEAKVREAENRLRDARHKESELIAKARQRAAAARRVGSGARG